MRKILFLLFLICLFSVSGICQNSFSPNINDFKSIYSGIYDLSNGYTNYWIGPLDKGNKWELSDEPKDLFSNKDLLDNNIEFDKTLLKVDDKIKVNLYRKFPVPKNKNDYPNPGYIVVLEKDNQKDVLFYRIKDIEANKNWCNYPIRFFDAIINKDLNEIYLLYMDFDGSIFYLYINTNEKITLREIIPPAYSLHTSTIGIKSLKFITNNVYRCERTDSSVKYYKLYIDYYNYEKNKNNNSASGTNRLIYWNQTGKSINESSKSWDYSDNEPEFNLDGWYYNK